MAKDINYAPDMIKVMQEKVYSKTEKIQISIYLSNDSSITYSIMNDTIVVESALYKNHDDLYRLFDYLKADIERFNIDSIYCKSRFPLSFAKFLDACFDLDGIVE